MKYRDNIAMIEELIASCDGVFTTAQADVFGVPRNALSYAAKVGRIERVAQGAYRDSSRMDSGYDELRAIWMLTASNELPFNRLGAKWDGVCVCGTTAANVLGIGDFHASPYHFAANRRINSRKSNAHFSKRLIDVDQIMSCRGLPVTKPERTIADLVEGHEDLSLVANAFIDAIRRYGSTSFDIRKLKDYLSESDYASLCEAAGIGVVYRLIVLDSVGHVALAEWVQDEQIQNTTCIGNGGQRSR